MRKVCELGRSMVEMLGVLAIIGVLSVGGIAGYSKAMLKHKINTTLDIVSGVIAKITELQVSDSLTGDIDVEDAPKIGLDCDLYFDEHYNGHKCKLPIGDYGFASYTNGSTYFSIYPTIDFAVDMCNAFFTSGIYKHLHSYEYIRIDAPVDAALFSPEDMININMSQISNTCKSTCSNPEAVCTIDVFFQ